MPLVPLHGTTLCFLDIPLSIHSLSSKSRLIYICQYLNCKADIKILTAIDSYFYNRFYLNLQPFLPLSDSGFIYDSDESIHSEEEDEDAFLSDAQIQEHKDANAYRLVEMTL